ncbi:hypothetical protein GCM10010124_37810 [Pilimelia terevasa]|uniref:DUF4360 domain-containing protein n=1 Tax=Pilimelia terevasa TaxID=53372 RepID=A0A8J3FJZ7_9ACTN|nr:DUF4360 domain-containing protein [Pilimelia terevasa]GGK41376.1 hypothetical protein GCM10010124_37810 [Pilimelia terevasa]
MSVRTLGLAAGVAGLIAATLSAAPAAAAVSGSVAVTAASGSGCAPDTVTAAEKDGKLEIRYRGHQAKAGLNLPKAAVSQCALSLAITPAAGYGYQLGAGTQTVDYQVEKGTYSSNTFHYRTDGEAGLLDSDSLDGPHKEVATTSLAIVEPVRGCGAAPVKPFLVDNALRHFMGKNTQLVSVSTYSEAPETPSVALGLQWVTCA